MGIGHKTSRTHRGLCNEHLRADHLYVPWAGDQAFGMVATIDAEPVASHVSNGVRSIVVVEDAQDVADSIRASLEHQGFRVSVVNNAAAALDLVLDHPPDLVLLDLSMPDSVSSDLCRRIREGTAPARVPILTLTALEPETGELLGI